MREEPNPNKDVYRSIELLFEEIIAQENHYHELQTDFEGTVGRRMHDERGQWHQLSHNSAIEIERLQTRIRNFDLEKQEQEERHGRYIQRVKRDHEDEMKGLRQKDKSEHQTKIQELRESFKNREDERQNRFDASKSRLDRELEKLHAKIRGYDQKVEAEKNMLRRGLENEASMARKCHLDEREEDAENFARERTRLESAREELVKIMETLKAQHLNSMERVRREFEDKLAERERAHADGKARMDTSMQTERLKYEATLVEKQRSMDEAKHNFNIEQEKMNITHAQAIEELGQSHISTLARNEADFKDERSQWEHEREAMTVSLQTQRTENEAEKEITKGQHDELISSLKTGFAKERKDSEKRHIEQHAGLKKDVEYLKGELLARDLYTPLTDDELRPLFLTLGHNIDDVSRTTWRANQKEWPSGVLSKLSSNQRIIKKQLIQDFVWAILFERIFCSPFRMFGEDGEKLEAQWNFAYGKEFQLEAAIYAWPEPGVQAERFRYKAMTTLQEAVTEPSSKWDPNADLKATYERSIRSIAKELGDTLAKVSDVDKSTQKTLEDIARNAAGTWLKMMTQHCRIVVRFPNLHPKSQSDRLEEAKRGSIELVVNPELRRIGNSKGQYLDKELKVLTDESTIKFPPK